MEKNSVGNGSGVVVIGGSAGSLEVLFRLLPLLKVNITPAVILVLHRRSTGDSSLSNLLSSKTILPLNEAEDKDIISPGRIYLAPSDYHLLIEKDYTFSLDYSEKINFSRPSLDVTFEAAADVYGPRATGIILSGANEDGTAGLKVLQAAGGVVIAQDPVTAQMPLMPDTAIKSLIVDHIFNLVEMAEYINSF